MIILLKEILAPSEDICAVPVKTTGLGKDSGLALVTVILFPILIWAALVNNSLVRGVIPPTAPEKLIFPAPATNVRKCAPFTAFVKLIAPPAEFNVVSFNKVTTPSCKVVAVVLIVPEVEVVEAVDVRPPVKV